MKFYDSQAEIYDAYVTKFRKSKAVETEDKPNEKESWTDTQDQKTQVDCIVQLYEDTKPI